MSMSLTTLQPDTGPLMSRLFAQVRRGQGAMSRALEGIGATGKVKGGKSWTEALTWV